MQEIYNDDFWLALHDTCLDAKIILEIGGGTGDGSTTAYQDAAKNGAVVYSVEARADRFALLSQKPWVKALHGSSVDASGYMSEEDVIKFWKEVPTSFSAYPLDFVKHIRNEELTLLQSIPNNVIDGLNADYVLIDGSPFTGQAELRKTIATARFVALDDIVDIKNYANFQELNTSPEWKLVWQNSWLRNGAAIFQRV